MEPSQWGVSGPSLSPKLRLGPSLLKASKLMRTPRQMLSPLNKATLCGFRNGLLIIEHAEGWVAHSRGYFLWGLSLLVIALWLTTIISLNPHNLRSWFHYHCFIEKESEVLRLSETCVSIHTELVVRPQDLIPSLPNFKVQHKLANSLHWLPVSNSLPSSAALVNADQRIGVAETSWKFLHINNAVPEQIINTVFAGLATSKPTFLFFQAFYSSACSFPVKCYQV